MTHTELETSALIAIAKDRNRHEYIDEITPLIFRTPACREYVKALKNLSTGTNMTADLHDSIMSDLDGAHQFIMIENWNPGAILDPLPFVKKIKKEHNRETLENLKIKYQNSEITLKELKEQIAKLDESLKIQLSDVGNTMDLAYQRSLKLKGKKYYGMPTGFWSLDNITKGFQSDLYIINAGPSTGKTTLFTQMAIHWAKNGYKGIFWSLETNKNVLGSYFIANELDITLTDAIGSKYTETQYNNCIRDLQKSGAISNLYVDDSSLVDIDLLEFTIIKQIDKLGGLDFIGIDYIQALNVPDDYKSQSQMVKSLKRLAKKYEICIIGLSQVGRASRGGNVVAGMESGRGGGQLEEAAFCIINLLNPNFDVNNRAINPKDGCPYPPNVLLAKVAKNKGGPRSRDDIWLVAPFDRTIRITEYIKGDHPEMRQPLEKTEKNIDYSESDHNNDLPF